MQITISKKGEVQYKEDFPDPGSPRGKIKMGILRKGSGDGGHHVSSHVVISLLELHSYGCRRRGIDKVEVDDTTNIIILRKSSFCSLWRSSVVCAGTFLG
jgi:hypothetical protein